MTVTRIIPLMIIIIAIMYYCDDGDDALYLLIVQSPFLEQLCCVGGYDHDDNCHEAHGLHTCWLTGQSHFYSKGANPQAFPS